MNVSEQKDLMVKDINHKLNKIYGERIIAQIFQCLNPGLNLVPVIVSCDTEAV